MDLFFGVCLEGGGFREMMDGVGFLGSGKAMSWRGWWGCGVVVVWCGGSVLGAGVGMDL